MRNYYGISEDSEVELIPTAEGILVRKTEPDYDEENRFTIPKGLRDYFGIPSDMAIDIIASDEGLLIRKRKQQIDEEGRITIPGRMREDYGFTPDANIDCVTGDGGILIQKFEPGTSPIDRVRGIIKMDMSTDEYMDIVRGRV